MTSSRDYLRLAPDLHLKVLEDPCVYDASADELYELSEEAMRFLECCDGTRTVEELSPEEDFLAYCLQEGILEALSRPRHRDVAIRRNETPSLRYLMVEVTDRCNLRCRHCYLGDTGGRDLAWEKVQLAVEGFEGIGGLRFMVTGGEPFLYPYFESLNESLAGRSFRSVVITNGTLMEGVDYGRLNFEEIQFSVDGLEAGHDYLRGAGTFEKVMRALWSALDGGVDVSVATVMHSRNLGELEELGERLKVMGVSSWTLEYPVPAGRMGENDELMPRMEDALPLFDLEWGLGPHEGAEGYACGAHLANLVPGGALVKCGYYRDISGGDVERGLREAWRALPKMRPAGICATCDLLRECGGGCRFRAEMMAGRDGPDPLMCARFGRHWRQAGGH